MINYETILSAFDDKDTLLKWLQKVEKALSKSTLTTVDCVNVNENYIKFTFNFADGTKIDTPQVYVKPGIDGTDGKDGADGKDGIGFDTLSEVDIPDSVASVLYSELSGATVSGTAVFKTGGGNFSVPVKNKIPVFGKGGVALAKDDTGKKLIVSLAGYDAATTGYYPRKSSSGLEWVAGTGGGATVETGTFSAPIFQANVGHTFSSWEQIPDKHVECIYSFIGDILTVRLFNPTYSPATISASKTIYVSLLPLMEIFNIPISINGIFTGSQLSATGTSLPAYTHTYVEDNVMFAIQFQNTIGYGTSTNAYKTSATLPFVCPHTCFSINGISKK